MRIAQHVFSCIGSAAFVLIIPVSFAAEPENPSKTVEIKTSKGLHFTVPPDWPIEERNGVVAPIPLEEYLSRKFSALETRLRSVEQQTTSQEMKLRVLEERIRQQQQTGLRSGEAASR